MAEALLRVGLSTFQMLSALRSTSNLREFPAVSTPSYDSIFRSQMSGPIIVLGIITTNRLKGQASFRQKEKGFSCTAQENTRRLAKRLRRCRIALVL